MNLTPPLDPAVLERTFGLFRLSRIVFVTAQLGIADHLVNGPQDVAALARLTGTHAPSLSSLLEVLNSYGVVSRDADGRYGLTPFSQRLVRGAKDGANVPFLLGWVGLPATYDAFGDLLHTIRTGESAFQARHGADFYSHLAAHPEAASLYEQAMEATSDAFAAGAKVYDFSKFQTLVDVGGGQGAFALAILERYPHLTAISYDLPQVVARTELKSHPALARLRLEGGDMFATVPAGADAYLTSTVLRCFDDERCLVLLRNIRRAMKPQSTLLAKEMIVPAARDHLPMNLADLTARVLYGGRDRTEREFAELFQQAGLRHLRTIPTTGTLAFLEAVPV